MLEYDKKQRINKSGSSPRDLQNRLNTPTDQNNQIILDLMMQVATLTAEVKNFKSEDACISSTAVISNDKKYTDNEFNEELIKALEKETSVFNLKLEAKDIKIQALEFKIEALVDIKDKLHSSNIDACKLLDPNKVVAKRPSIEESVIDPTENKSKLESYINIEETDPEIKIDMKNKVNRLKELLGGK